MSWFTFSCSKHKHRLESSSFIVSSFFLTFWLCDETQSTLTLTFPNTTRLARKVRLTFCIVGDKIFREKKRILLIDSTLNSCAGNDGHKIASSAGLRTKYYYLAPTNATLIISPWEEPQHLLFYFCRDPQNWEFHTGICWFCPKSLHFQLTVTYSSMDTFLVLSKISQMQIQ